MEWALEEALSSKIALVEMILRDESIISIETTDCFKFYC